MVLSTDINVILRQSEQHTTSALERIRASQSALESMVDHHTRMMESIDKSRALLASLNGRDASATASERGIGSASIERGPAEG